jgi:hypothetical protein
MSYWERNQKDELRPPRERKEVNTILFHEPKCVVFTKHKDERMKFYCTIDYDEARDRWINARRENLPVVLNRVQGMGNQPVSITIDHSMITIIEPYT